MSYWDYEPVGPPNIFDSKVESEVFGISVIRANYSNWSGIDSELETAMQKSDLVILRTRDTKPFEALDGFTVIPAGTLIYWTSEEGRDLDLENSEYHLELNLVDSSLRHFSDVLRDSFTGYKNHYDLNSALNAHSTSDAYLQWAMSRVDSDALTGLLTFQEAPIGVISAVQQGDLVEVEIAGIAHSAQGHGHYKHLIGQLWKMVDQPNSSRLVI